MVHVGWGGLTRYWGSVPAGDRWSGLFSCFYGDRGCKGRRGWCIAVTLMFSGSCKGLQGLQGVLPRKDFFGFLVYLATAYGEFPKYCLDL